MQETTSKLARILAKASVLLADISERDASRQSLPGKWSKKQELGHLIDSACNNHQRIVRAQLEAEPDLPGYNGDQWVELHNYKGKEWKQIIECWHTLNMHLLQVIAAISEQDDERKLTVEGNEMTLDFLVKDYIAHLLHHLRRIGINIEE